MAFLAYYNSFVHECFCFVVKFLKGIWDMNIFREEALNHQTDSDYGEIVLPASFGLSVSALTTLFIFLCLILFIFYGSYTRKAHLSGIVMPSSGLVKITPQYACT